MAVSVKVTKVWPVEKYARFISDPALPAALLEGKRSGAWQHYSTRDGVIQMALLESNHLMVSSGNQIYESFSLWETRKWIKGVTKGDSVLFLYRLKDENRKFRVKFLPLGPNSSSLETCKSCTATLAHLVPIREMTASFSGSSTGSDGPTGGLSDSQLPCYDDSQFMSQPPHEASLPQERAAVPVPTAPVGTGCRFLMQGGGTTGICSAVSHIQQRDVSSNDAVLPLQGALSTELSGKLLEDEQGLVADNEMISIPDLAEAIQSESKSLGRAYAETNFPTEQLGTFIRLCLTDANFPGFVEAVEKELNIIATEK